MAPELVSRDLATVPTESGERIRLELEDSGTDGYKLRDGSSSALCFDYRHGTFIHWSQQHPVCQSSLTLSRLSWAPQGTHGYLFPGFVFTAFLFTPHIVGFNMALARFLGILDWYLSLATLDSST